MIHPLFQACIKKAGGWKFLNDFKFFAKILADNGKFERLTN